jgi:hypothetical protein
MSCLKFSFKLREFDRIEPWGQGEDRNLHWFGLSDGAYCIETSAGNLLELPDISAQDLGVRWLDYQVVRMFEDVLDVWPFFREPVPIDVTERYFAWRPLNEDAWFDKANSAARDTWSEATHWWREREVSLSYLRQSPQLHFWRSESSAHLEWRAEAPWSPPEVHLYLPFEAMQQAAASFAREFLSEMGARVLEIERLGWQPKNANLDIAHLAREQKAREEEAELALSNVVETNWTSVRRALTKLGA